MNQKLKVIIATLGAINVVFSCLIPIVLSLMLVKIYNINGISLAILIIAASLSSVYRAIDVAGLDTLQYILEKYITKNSKK